MPAYEGLRLRGGFEERASQARAVLQDCQLCPRRCRVDRLHGETGACHLGAEALVSSYGPHFGEEGPLVGSRGSGTIFFAGCNLGCLFCQNYTISQQGHGSLATPDEISGIMLSLQGRGCHNINLVSSTHVVPQILEALSIAVEAGLSIPIVYNCGGYESLDTLKLLDGIVDIYMPDMKYSDEVNACRYSGVRGYPRANRAAVKEMHRQVGDLQMDECGVAVRGLLVRHLVLPNGLAGTEGVFRFLAEEVSKDTYVNIMNQYYPTYHAPKVPALSRPLLRQEFDEAVELAQRYGLERLDEVRPRSVAIDNR